MRGPSILVRAMSTPTIHDQYRNVWQYHSRSDRHSKVACWGVAFDLFLTSALLRRHAADGKVVFGLNHEMRDFGTGRSKKLDLVVARPAGAIGDVTFDVLADRYALNLDSEERSDLAEIPPLVSGAIGAVLLAVEAKATMTAHVRALPRLYDELNSSHLCVHGASRQALAIGYAVVNASTEFVSPDRNRRSLKRRAPEVSTEPQPRSLERTLAKIAEIPRRSNTRETGFDGIGISVVDGKNDGTAFRVVSAPPAPQPGEPFEYGGMIARMANEYDTMFASI